MYPRTEYEMTEADLETLINACRATPVMLIGGYSARASAQENANRAWAALGAKMGFDGASVRPIEGKGNRFFTAVPNETENARTERLAAEAETRRLHEIARLAGEIADRQHQMNTLLDKAP